MIIESPEDINKFLKLEAMPANELKKKYETENKDTKQKTHLKLIDFLMRRTRKEQNPVLPQGIPLRSKYPNGKPIPNTSKNYKKWRKLIFNTKAYENFQLINKDGKQYTSKVNYIKCEQKAASHIIENEWHSAYETQNTLIKQIKKNPSQFEYNIIIKTTNNGNNFLMLHCQPKKD